MKAIGKESMRPTMAATSPRSKVSGPMVTRSADVESVAMRIIGQRREEAGDGPDGRRHHLGVDPRQAGQIGIGDRWPGPTRRTSVWFSSHHSPTVVTGTAMRARTCAPLMVTPPPRLPLAVERTREGGLSGCRLIVGKRQG